MKNLIIFKAECLVKSCNTHYFTFNQPWSKKNINLTSAPEFVQKYIILQHQYKILFYREHFISICFCSCSWFSKGFLSVFGSLAPKQIRLWRKFNLFCEYFWCIYCMQRWIVISPIDNFYYNNHVENQYFPMLRSVQHICPIFSPLSHCIYLKQIFHYLISTLKQIFGNRHIFF